MVERLQTDCRCHYAHTENLLASAVAVPAELAVACLLTIDTDAHRRRLLGIAHLRVAHTSNSKFKKLGGILCLKGCRTIKHKINQRLPVVKEKMVVMNSNGKHVN